LDEEEESDGGRVLSERWEPAPPSPRATEVAEEIAPGAGAGVPVARQPMREAARTAGEPTRTAEAPACAAEVTRGVAVATSVVATTPVEPPRNRKRGFSTLR
jgi:hypothetical protein